MSEIKVKDKDIVVPGEVLATGMDFLPSYGTYRLGEEIRAFKLGLVKTEGKVVKIVPLSGRYLPKRGDTIVAEVIDVLMSGWRLETNSAYSAMLSMKEASSRFINRGADLTRIYALGDIVVCTIVNVTSQKLVDVSMRGPGLRKLEGGRIIEVNTNKVPRIIGKEGSMISMIKNATGCRVSVGQNGIVWIQGGSTEAENIAIMAIRKAEEEAHTDGLTDRIKEFLEKETKGMKIERREPMREEGSFQREEGNSQGYHDNNHDSNDNSGMNHGDHAGGHREEW